MRYIFMRRHTQTHEKSSISVKNWKCSQLINIETVERGSENELWCKWKMPIWKWGKIKPGKLLWNLLFYMHTKCLKCGKFYYSFYFYSHLSLTPFSKSFIMNWIEQHIPVILFYTVSIQFHVEEYSHAFCVSMNTQKLSHFLVRLESCRMMRLLTSLLWKWKSICESKWNEYKKINRSEEENEEKLRKRNCN